MPDFWQTPTGSMGIGPISAVYQARFMRYLRDRGLAETDGRRVWGVFGDGEMDEPELLAGLSLAAREKLDNLTFIINCNLQRLDGPVRGNGQIIQELEMIFRGAGWNVIKVLWGTEWDVLFARDVNHALLRRFAATVDGKYQKLGAEDGAYNLTHFFDEDPEVRALVAHMSDRDVDALKRGGHDFRKLFAAFELAQGDEGTADGHPRQDQEGFWHGRGGRVADDRPPDEEARYRGAARVPRPLRAAAQRRAGRKIGFLPSVRQQRGTRRICASGGGRSAAICRRADARRRRSPCRRSRATRISPSIWRARRCRRRWPPCACSAIC